MLSGPIMGTHNIQPVAFVTEHRRFGLIQFPSSQLRSLFWHFAYFTTLERFFLLVANLVFAALPHAALHGPRVALLGMAKLPLISTLFLPSFLGFFHLLFVLAPGLLRVYCWCLLEQFALA